MVRGRKCLIARDALRCCNPGTGWLKTLPFVEDIIETRRGILGNKLCLDPCCVVCSFRLNSVNLLVCRFETTLLHQNISTLAWLSVEITTDKHPLSRASKLSLPVLQPVQHVLALMLPDVIVKSKLLAWVVQVKVDEDHVLILGCLCQIVPYRDHVAISDSAQLQIRTG